MNKIIGRLPTIPEYYSMYIDKDVDLNKVPKQCCPFHNENTPSFSYSLERDVWRCFGACNCGGDVIELHRKKFRIRTRKEAELSLNRIFHVIEKPVEQYHTPLVRESRVEEESVYQLACTIANTPERWIELDYIMSIYPLDIGALKELIEKWKG